MSKRTNSLTLNFGTAVRYGYQLFFTINICFCLWYD